MKNYQYKIYVSLKGITSFEFYVENLFKFSKKICIPINYFKSYEVLEKLQPVFSYLSNYDLAFFFSIFPLYTQEFMFFLFFHFQHYNFSIEIHCNSIQQLCMHIFIVMS